MIKYYNSDLTSHQGALYLNVAVKESIPQRLRTLLYINAKRVHGIKQYKIFTAEGQDISRPVKGALVEFKHTLHRLQNKNKC